MSRPKMNAGRIELRPVTVTAEAVVRSALLTEHGDGPVVFGPTCPDVDLVGWAVANRHAVEVALHTYGALLFRGFDVVRPEDLERFASVFVQELFADNGEHPRAALSANVYTPTFFPAEEKLLWHNENSFNDAGPAMIWFCCQQPARSGGETPIVDSRQVYQRIDRALREEFISKGVMYVRNFGTGVGLDWRTVFRTDSRHEVEASCTRQGVHFEWHDDRLRTVAVRPAVVRHPRTGQWSWFNQAQHWHLSCLDSALRASLLTTFAPDELPRQCYFGDASPIPDAAMDEICLAYQELEVAFAWQRGDVLMLDNILVAHARNPYRGERRILVTMGDVIAFQPLGPIGNPSA